MYGGEFSKIVGNLGFQRIDWFNIQEGRENFFELFICRIIAGTVIRAEQKKWAHIGLFERALQARHRIFASNVCCQTAKQQSTTSESMARIIKAGIQITKKYQSIDHAATITDGLSYNIQCESICPTGIEPSMTAWFSGRHQSDCLKWHHWSCWEPQMLQCNSSVEGDFWLLGRIEVLAHCTGFEFVVLRTAHLTGIID